MQSQKRKHLNRKEFLQRSTAGVIGLGLAGVSSAENSRKTTGNTSLHYRTLGRTGLSVSFIGHGASRVEVPSVVRGGIDKGINFIDTGRMYSEGKNEEMLGKDRYVVTPLT